MLATSPWVHWGQIPIAADASARSYRRLVPRIDVPAAAPVIVMDAPPDTGEDTRPFARITAFLRDAGLAAPSIHLHDPDLGIMVLEDLGTEDFANWIKKHPTDIEMLYKAAADVLVTLAELPHPENLPVMNPVTGGRMVEITAEWYAENRKGAQLCAAVQDHLERLAPDPAVLALRDFHAENLIWRPEQTGSNRVGLLDYQDAFIAPAGYDLASLLRDARRDVDPVIVQTVIAYFVASARLDKDRFSAQFACLSVQRNLRILGIFARLIRRDRKLKYVQYVPRVWSLIQTDLAHPSLHELKKVVGATLPSPEMSTLKEFL